jgi:hypothetical protein
MEKSNQDKKKFWNPKEIKDELKRINDKIESIDDMNTENISVQGLQVEKGKFLKDKAKDHEKAEEVFREALKTAVGPNQKLEILFEILQMTIHRVEVHVVKQDIEEC